MSRTTRLLAKLFVKGTAVTYVAGKAVVNRGAGFVGSLYEDVKDEINKEEQAKDEPVQLDLPLEVIEDHETGQRTVTILKDGDPNETAQKA